MKHKRLRYRVLGGHLGVWMSIVSVLVTLFSPMGSIVAPAMAQTVPSIVLEDFATRRLTWANDGTKLFDVYLGEGPDQIDGGISNGVWTVTGATTAGAPAGCYTGCGLYWQFLTYPYLWNGGSKPNGFMQGYIKSGTFDANNTNRLQFKMMCTADVPRPTDGSSTFNTGKVLQI